jgi:hypothetical protein
MGQVYRVAFTATILERVPPHVPVSFSRTTFLSSIADWSRFRSGEVRVGGLERVSAESRVRLSKDDSPKTEAEKAGGRLPGFARAGAGLTGISSASELRALFTEQILSAQLEASACKRVLGVLAIGLVMGHGSRDHLPLAADVVG